MNSCFGAPPYLEDAQLPNLQSAMTVEGSDSTRAGLRAIRSWYGLASTRLYRDDPEKLTLALNALVGDFWLQTYRQKEQSADGNLRSATAIERDVLKVLLDEPELVASVPLLQLICDALHGLSQSIEMAATFHDVGCLTDTCPPSSQVADFYRVLSQIGEGQALHDVAKASTSIPDNWRDIFQLLARESGALQSAIADAERLSSQLALPVAPLLRFRAMRDQAETRSTRFATAKLFRSSASTLRAGIQSSLGAEIASDLEIQASVLDTERHQFENARQQEIDRLRQEARSSGGIRTAQIQVDEQLRLLNRATDEHGALQVSIRAQEAMYADAVGKMTKLESRANSRADYDVLSGPHVVEISAENARALAKLKVTDCLHNTVLTRADGSDWKIETTAGDILHITATGQWSPTCTLRQETLRRPLGSSEAVTPAAPNLSHALTGPDGFTIQWTNEQCDVVSNDTAATEFKTDTRTAHASAGVATSAGFSMFGTGAVASIGAGIDLSNSSGETTTDTESKYVSNARRAIASFPIGYRSPNAPLPLLPVGSLVFVAVPRGDVTFSRIRDARVVQQQSALVVDKDSDFYFLVNDQAGCEVTEKSALTVAVSHTRLRSSSVQGFASGMANAVASIRSRTPDLLSQGALSPEQMSSIRAEALELLRSSTAHQFSEVDEVGGFFVAWLDSELSLLRLRTQAYDKLKEMAQLEASIHLMTREIDLEKNDARILKLAPLRQAHNIEISAMSGPVASILEYMADHVYPLMRLRYPDALDRLRQKPEFTVLVRSLSDVSLLEASGGDAVLDLTRKSALMAREVAAAVRSARRLAPPESRKLPVVAISFPRGEQKDIAEWRRADEARCRIVWQSVEKGSVATFTVRPQDLYGNGMGTTLKCFNAAPVIRSMGLFIEVPDDGTCDGFNARDRTAAMVVGEVMTFPSERGPETFHIENGAWRNDAIRLLCGHSLDAVQAFRSLPEDLKVANGMSPFGTFQIDFRAESHEVQSKIASASGLTLLFDLGSRRLGSSNQMNWLDACNDKVAAIQ